MKHKQAITYGFKIEQKVDDKITYNICKDVNETLKRLEYYLKFPPYVKNRTIHIFDITKKEVEEGIFNKLPWYPQVTFYII